MKLKNFILNCLNRRSFQFLSVIGLITFCIPFLIAFFYYGTSDYLIFVLLPTILPTLGLVTILTVISIYIKLLFREHSKPKYRIKKPLLTPNLIYALFAFGFYIFAFVSITLLLYANVKINI